MRGGGSRAKWGGGKEGKQNGARNEGGEGGERGGKGGEWEGQGGMHNELHHKMALKRILGRSEGLAGRLGIKPLGMVALVDVASRHNFQKKKRDAQEAG